ncbi:hypothetical protein F5879DRAFT_1028496 [Lentinula edodes]|nr:hypothetical protein F5879DRAFT_1028496 [Lentinula edodes]KAJ3916844.1 hypothetical protein F5877DRAFT_80515 [Lentinula edodes]
MLTLLPLRLLAMFLLLLPSILVVTAAPLTDVDMVAQVEKRTEPKGPSGKIKRMHIVIYHTHCSRPRINFLLESRPSSADRRPHGTKKIIANIGLTDSQKPILCAYLKSIQGTNDPWVWMFAAMEHLQTLPNFEFADQGKKEWDEMRNKCKRTPGVPLGFNHLLVEGKPGPV